MSVEYLPSVAVSSDVVPLGPCVLSCEAEDLGLFQNLSRVSKVTADNLSVCLCFMDLLGPKWGEQCLFPLLKSAILE